MIYRFTGSPATPNQAVVLASADGGASWTGRFLPPDAEGATTATVTFPGLAWDTSAPRTLQVCVRGAGGSGTLHVDMLHLDVQE